MSIVRRSPPSLPESGAECSCGKPLSTWTLVTSARRLYLERLLSIFYDAHAVCKNKFGT